MATKSDAAISRVQRVIEAELRELDGADYRDFVLRIAWEMTSRRERLVEDQDEDEREAEAAWADFSETHILPSQRFRLAQGLCVATEDETRHLEECERCRQGLGQFKGHPSHRNHE